MTNQIETLEAIDSALESEDYERALLLASDAVRQHPQDPLRLGGVDQDRGHRLRRSDVVSCGKIGSFGQLEQGFDRVRWAA